MSDTPNKPSRGRPRSEEVRQAILKAFVTAAVEHGYEKISIDAVAKVAGVSRSTIYRWYRDKRELVLDAGIDIVSNSGFAPLAEGRGFEVDMALFLGQTFATANEIGQLFTAMMAEAQADEAFAEQVWQRYAQPRRQLLGDIIRQHPGAKDLPEERMAFVLDMIFGIIWYRMMSRHAPLDDQFQSELKRSVELLIQAG